MVSIKLHKKTISPLRQLSLFPRDNGNWHKQRMTHRLGSRPWMAEGLSVAALALFLCLCVRGSESEGSGDGAPWSASACAWSVASESWTATSSAWETCRGDNFRFSKSTVAVKKKMILAGRPPPSCFNHGPGA